MNGEERAARGLGGAALKAADVAQALGLGQAGQHALEVTAGLLGPAYDERFGQPAAGRGFAAAAGGPVMAITRPA